MGRRRIRVLHPADRCCGDDKRTQFYRCTM
jgi:hypothetical protein